jgi:serine phosphatase RsbU (regulator of sigma subunit)
VREGDVIRLDAERGLPMGMFGDTCYREGRQQLEPGDLIAFFTDGVTEAPGADGEEFGERRLVELLRTHRDLDLDTLLRTVLDEVARWSGGTISHDDVTLVLARAR